MTGGDWAVLLAAGASRRLGQPKQLVQLGGVPLVRRQVEALRQEFGDRLIVVTGHAAPAVAQALSGIVVREAHNAAWATGMGSSIAAGVAALPATARRVLLATCDQAQLRSGDYGALLAAGAGDGCVAARYAGKLGIPALFPRRMFAALRALEGDRGARRLLTAEPAVHAVDLPAAAFDLDTREDLASLAPEQAQQ